MAASRIVLFDSLGQDWKFLFLFFCRGQEWERI